MDNLLPENWLQTFHLGHFHLMLQSRTTELLSSFTPACNLSTCHHGWFCTKSVHPQCLESNSQNLREESHPAGPSSLGEVMNILSSLKQNCKLLCLAIQVQDLPSI